MDDKKIIDILLYAHQTLRNIYEGAVPGGGEAFANSRRGKELLAAAEALRNRQPTTIGELEQQGRI